MKLRVNCTGINYEVAGSGPALVLSHSLASNLHMWEPQMDGLTRSFTVIRFDTRGHGLSDAPNGPYSMVELAEDAGALMEELGVHFETSASEAAAAAMLSASVMYPVRGAVTWKSTAGTNVASDALSNLSSGGVIGGALIIIGEDYGEGSSIMQERSHAFAMKSQIWLLDPRPNLPCIVKAVKDGFALSEASRTPVMLQLRIRACHVHGEFVAADNVTPGFTVQDALANPQRDVSRIVLRRPCIVNFAPCDAPGPGRRKFGRPLSPSTCALAESTAALMASMRRRSCPTTVARE